MHLTPYRIILLGDGLLTWDEAVMNHFKRCNEGKSYADLKTEVDEVMANPGRGGYYSEHLMGEQIVMVKMSCRDHNKGKCSRLVAMVGPDIGRLGMGKNRRPGKPVRKI